MSPRYLKISGRKSAVQNNVIGGHYDRLIGFQRCRYYPRSMLQLETTVMKKTGLLRGIRRPLSTLVTVTISSNDVYLL